MASRSDVANLSLSLDAFLRSIAISPGTVHGMFIGAGASISSGVPSANTCLWQWKRNIFYSSNPSLTPTTGDISLPGMRSRIQQWLDREGGFPDMDSPDEYGVYAERCFPIAEDRRRYFQSLAAQAVPNVGYEMLALLARAGVVGNVWTTNFDGLVARAATSEGIAVVEVGLDTASRITRQRQRGELMSVALHGDYRYDALKNTPNELQANDRQLTEAFIETLSHTTLIVSGYSGRDETVMNALTEAYSQSGTGRLFWCGHGNTDPDTVVHDLLSIARGHGREAYYVPTDGFDDLLVRLALQCLGEPLRARAQQAHQRLLRQTTHKTSPFTVDGEWTSGLVKSNAFVIECPNEVFRFRASGFNSPRAWSLLRELVKNHDVEAALFQDTVLALGTLSSIRDVFGDRIQGNIESYVLSGKDLSISDGIVISLLTRALIRVLCDEHGLASNGRSMIWETAAVSRQQVAGIDYRVHDAAILALRRYQGRQYLVVKPTLKVTTPHGDDAPVEVEKEVKRIQLTKQHNQEFNRALELWRKRLFTSGSRTMSFPHGSSSSFRFTVPKPTPSYARLVTTDRSQALKISEHVERHIVQSGTVYGEPRLLFSDSRGEDTVADVHPMRGIATHRPYDYALTTSGLSNSIAIGIVCSEEDSKQLASFLDNLNYAKPADSKLDYLLDYPGFGPAFGAAIRVPSPGDTSWVSVANPSVALDQQRGSKELATRLSKAIDTLSSQMDVDVVLVYVPARWRSFERFATDDGEFDLHDSVKAHAVQRGVATQFLRESTLSKAHTCEVLWWLALSFYVKAMRTPWILDQAENDTVFLGIGYSHARSRRDQDNILLGCSHMYNANGLGLGYRLSKIENPIIHQRTPYMSRPDAQRIGDSARQLFFESMMRLPRRVVVHKRTPFTGEEREGLLSGLSGVETVDMLEITVDKLLRYAASYPTREGTFQEDRFPVKRGTAVPLDDRRALLWVHGSVPGLSGSRRYYLGNNRIPAPLVVTRHHGETRLSTLAYELLGLSKMNWNTFDLYSKLPATIESSNTIARIGRFLGGYAFQSYDYRLFI